MRSLAAISCSVLVPALTGCFSFGPYEPPPECTPDYSPPSPPEAVALRVGGRVELSDAMIESGSGERIWVDVRDHSPPGLASITRSAESISVEATRAGRLSLEIVSAEDETKLAGLELEVREPTRWWLISPRLRRRGASWASSRVDRPPVLLGTESYFYVRPFADDVPLRSWIHVHALGEDGPAVPELDVWDPRVSVTVANEGVQLVDIPGDPIGFGAVSLEVRGISEASIASLDHIDDGAGLPADGLCHHVAFFARTATGERIENVSVEIEAAEVRGIGSLLEYRCNDEPPTPVSARVRDVRYETSIDGVPVRVVTCSVAGGRGGSGLVWLLAVAFAGIALRDVRSRARRRE